MEQSVFFICNPKDGDEVFLAPFVREKDVFVSMSLFPSGFDLWTRRIGARVVNISGGFKDLSADEQAMELEKDLHEVLSTIISDKVSFTILLRDFNERVFYAFSLISLLCQVPAIELKAVNLWWIKELNGRNKLITYQLSQFGSKAEIKGFDDKELPKAYAILLASRQYPVYARLLAKCWSDPGKIEAERRRVSKILSKLKEQGFVEMREQYMDHYGKGRVRLTSVPINSYKTTIKGRIALANVGEVEREEVNNLAEQILQVVEQGNLLARDIWVEDIVPFCPVYKESLRGRLIVSSSGQYAIPVKPDYLSPKWHYCSFIFVDIQKPPFELDKKEIISLLSKLGKMTIDDLQVIYRRRLEQGISGPLAFPMSARPWLDDPGEIGGSLKECIDRLVCIFNPCPFLQNGVCLVQTPTLEWGFEPDRSLRKIQELYEQKKRYNY